MLIKSLKICNFGLFKDEHVIDLKPRKNSSSDSPIILFGGLNGAGKTTILTAIRLVIYGKQSLGHNIPQKTYDEYLKAKIHKNANAIVAANGASLCLEIVYYKLGKPTNYTISRSWSTSGKQLNEILTISQDGQEIPGFSKDQFQAFLNELIPLGVSELFFFDGEKIAKLADEGGDETLGDAIRKLLGLDIIERLKNDLHLYHRKQANNNIFGNSKSDIEELEKSYLELKRLINEEEIKAQTLHPLIIEERTKLSKLEDKLAISGGAWAVSRESLKAQVDSLLLEKKLIEAEIREHLTSIFPFSLAPRVMSQLNRQLQNEQKLKEWESVATGVTSRLDDVKSVLLEYVDGTKQSEALFKLNSIFGDLIERPEDLKSIDLIHDLGKKDTSYIAQIVDQFNSEERLISHTLSQKLTDIEEALANISLKLDRAPNEETLQSTFEEIKSKIQLISNLNSKRDSHFETARQLTKNAIEVVRSLKKLEANLTNSSAQSQAALLATQTQNVLADFVEEMTKRKISKLEKEFSFTFSRLARKGNTEISAKINPTSFEVLLFNKEGSIISKQDLSAGEKQIYAVAMLEALAKTSGRKLPIIIDTPLGRLDSIHREKIVNNYFPNASHQMIILSTDTEIDQGHFEDISQFVSHSFRIIYDESSASSGLNEGYFWGQEEGLLDGVHNYAS